MVLIRKKHVETAEEKESRLKKEAEMSAGIQDQYQARGFELVSWVQDHKVLVSVMIAVLLLGGIGYSGFGYYQQRANEAATTKFLAVMKDIDGVTKEDADKTAKWQKAQADLKDVAGNFSRSKVANLANLYAGHLALEANDPKAALESYKSAVGEISKADPLYPVALIGLGYAQERNGDAQAALASFEGVINAKDGMGKDLALFEAARLASELKDNDKAKTYREQLIKDYPNSVYEKNLMRLAIQ